MIQGQPLPAWVPNRTKNQRRTDERQNIRITSAFYADKKKVVTPKTFAGLLGTSGNVEAGEFPESAPQKQIDR